ncbi:Fur family transcriptional regulator [Ruficoccus sp. ZRK36]|uniref:Fur family transcriptional regulator n=1 Tax=Ruficoccus sp. ZRK36 TaxID=2866311 RepID=UPI001C72F2AE|nr:Fur family transcriptional regulator [Ruficoccus sp. ZRK36]QYY35725.1 transcriptional repressor [Ruficoccus sp. ZRK36]
MKLSTNSKRELEEALVENGLRATRQREHVYAVLLTQRDHPTADEVYARAKQVMPSISLATVYNCLETLVECDLVKKLNYEREPSRFCPNDGEHAHFLDEGTGRVFDIDLPENFMHEITNVLPQGFEAKKFKLSFTGYAPKDLPGDHCVAEN